MDRRRLIEETLRRCGDISADGLADSLSFGRRTISDPDTGANIPVEGYPIEKNERLLQYIFAVVESSERYHSCLKDLFFFEVLLLEKNIPSFELSEHLPQYLKINYQAWIIKVNTVCECTLHAINAVYMLGIKPKFIKSEDILKRSAVIGDADVITHLETLYAVLNDENNKWAKLGESKSIRLARHGLVHSNEFDHSEIEYLDSTQELARLKALDIDPFDLQAMVGSTSAGINDEVAKTNYKILQEVYPIFEYLGREYRRKFNLLLVK